MEDGDPYWRPRFSCSCVCSGINEGGGLVSVKVNSDDSDDNDWGTLEDAKRWALENPNHRTCSEEVMDYAEDLLCPGCRESGHVGGLLSPLVLLIPDDRHMTTRHTV